MRIVLAGFHIESACFLSIGFGKPPYRRPKRPDSRWRFVRGDQALFLKRQLSLPVSTMSQ